MVVRQRGCGAVLWDWGVCVSVLGDAALPRERCWCCALLLVLALCSARETSHPALFGVQGASVIAEGGQKADKSAN